MYRCVLIIIFLFPVCIFANPIIQMETSRGDIILELFEKESPKTVENFLAYVEDGFYSNTIFHRVIDGCMIQAGGYASGMREKKMREPIINESLENSLKNLRGTIALAQTLYPHSGASQFFINVVDNPHLDADIQRTKSGFTVFGKVIKGMEVVDAIRRVRTRDMVIYSEFYSREVPIYNVPEEEVSISIFDC